MRIIDTLLATVDYERLYLDNLGTIDQVARIIARRHHLSQDDSEELCSSARFKVFDNGYEVLRRFEQRSNLRTYLLVIIERHFLDARMAQWGKWRPSKEARRSGTVAVLLDRLLTRDNLSFDQACEVLRINHRVIETRAELYAMSLRLPNRTGRRLVGEEHLEDLPSSHSAPENSLDISSAEAASVEEALGAALATLQSHDRLLLKMRFRDGLSVAEMSRILRLDQKALYRHLYQIGKVLREKLEARGVSRDRIRALVGHPSVNLAPIISEETEGNVSSGPSSQVTGTLTSPEAGGRRDG